MNLRYTFFSVILIFCSCSDVDISPECRTTPDSILNEIENDFKGAYQNTTSPIFGGNLISIAPYNYFDNGIFQIHGDTMNKYLEGIKLINSGDFCNALNIINVMSSEPRFEWRNTGDKLVAAAVFSKRIKLNQELNKIQNVNDIVWAWHSGLNTGGVSGSKYVVTYNEGRKVIDGKIADEIPLPLKRNQVYVWAVWAWDEQGTRIIKSSMEIPFIVEGFISLNHPQQMVGNWVLEKATDTKSSQDMTASLQDVKSLDIKIENCATIVDSVEVNGIDFRYSYTSNVIELPAAFILTDIKVRCNSFSGKIMNSNSAIEVVYKLKQ